MRLRRRALATTVMELRLLATPANMGWAISLEPAIAATHLRAAALRPRILRVHVGIPSTGGQAASAIRLGGLRDTSPLDRRFQVYFFQERARETM